MPLSLRTPTPVVVALAVVSIASPSCVDIAVARSAFDSYVERDEKRFQVTGTPDVTVSTFDGSIEIRPWDRSEVLVVVEKHAADKEATAAIEVKAEQNGGHIVVDVGVPTRDWILTLGWHDSPTAKLVVSVPSASNLQAASGDGSITVEGITGQVELTSGDGHIQGHGLTGSLRAHTGDGSIRFDSVRGTLDVETGDGSVAIDGQVKSLRARSGDGSVRVHAEAGSATAESWDLATGDGSVTLELAEDFGGELDAHTGHGRIRMQDIALSDVPDQIPSTSMRGRIGTGGRAVRVRTGDGSITLRRF